jgi:acetyl esterase/lipase
MSAEELKIVNELLRAGQSGMRGGSWAERRAGMEAAVAVFPLAEGVALTPVDANGVPAEWQGRAGAPDDTALLYFHGGGYAIGSIATHRSLTTAIAAGFHGRVLSVDYRLAPEHPCPAAIEDAVNAYRYLLDQGIKGARIVVAGDSAGGGLTIAALQAIRDAGLPAPAGGWVLSPWVDLTGSSASMASKTDDLMITAEALAEYAAAYAPGGDAKDPRATPLHGALAGLPPLLIQVGTSERLLDDALTLAREAAAEDVAVTLEAVPGQPHVFQMFGPLLSEAREAIARAVAWSHRQIG